MLSWRDEGRLGFPPCSSVEAWNDDLPVSFMTGDVRSRAQFQDIMKHTVERHGGLDILVANAGVSVTILSPQWLPQKQHMISMLIALPCWPQSCYKVAASMPNPGSITGV